MGTIPVFFAVQGPGQFDANGIVLFAFGKVISQSNEQNTHQSRNDTADRNFNAHCRGKGDRRYNQRQYRDAPFRDQYDAAAQISAFGVIIHDYAAAGG